MRRLMPGLAVAAALAACGSDDRPAPIDPPPPDTTPPALTGFTPGAGQAVKAPFDAVATFSEPVSLDAAWFRSELEEHAVHAEAAGSAVTVSMPLVNTFGSRVRLDVRDAAGNPASVWVGDWYAQPIYLEWVLPELNGPFSGTILLWVAWAGPPTLAVYVDDTPVGTLGKDLPIDTTAFADGPHTFWFEAPGYQRTPQAFAIDNTP